MIRENDRKPKKCPPSAPACANCEPPKHPCPKGVIVNCCTGAGVNTGIIAVPDLPPPETPISLVCAAVDTTCLCKPIVKVEFNCNICFSNISLSPVSLVFQLKKSCDNGQDIICDNRTMARNVDLSNSPNDSFAFTFCDCNPCPGCCTYSVELISFEVPFGESTVTIFIGSPTIKTIAIETCNTQNIDCSSDISLYSAATGTHVHQNAKCPAAAPVCADCEPRHPCPQGILFNCCTGAGLQTTNLCPATPLPLVCTTIDTTCLCRPLIALDFSTIITAAIPLDSLITLIFQVRKSCANEQDVVCGNWTFARVTTDDLILSDSFRFTFCDCNPCPGCCTYTVELLSCRTIGVFFNPFAGTFSINAPTASILAVDTCPQS